jgi:uracil-DNA glycosylase
MSGDWAASALSWWQEAGVDTIVGEEARDWLNPRSREAMAPAATAAAPETLPGDLAGFQEWLLQNLPVAGSAPVGPAGDPSSGLMVMVDMPSSEDVAAGRLLSGEAGSLFDRMMSAMAPPRSRDSLYLASLSPSRTATGMLGPEEAAELARIALHHVGLVAPTALLLFGDACSKALLGAPVARARGRWHELDTPAGTVRAVATIRPEKLLAQPNLKKLAWEDLQRLMEGLNP